MGAVPIEAHEHDHRDPFEAVDVVLHRVGEPRRAVAVACPLGLPSRSERLAEQRLGGDGPSDRRAARGTGTADGSNPTERAPHATGSWPGRRQGSGRRVYRRIARVVASPSRSETCRSSRTGDHRPWNSGWRFSMNARTPSVKSSVRRSGQQLEEHVVHVLLERLGLGGAHHALDRPNGQRCVRGDVGGHLAVPLVELADRNDLVDQTELQRLGRRSACGR